MDALLPPLGAGLTQVFSWPAFGLMLIGIGIGFLIGILPGISAPTTLAIMLPFTFGMKPVEAFAFLLGMLSVSVMFGDITSILFGVPGEPLSAAVVLDGHPMAKRGEAGRALGAALMSSLIGAVVGAVVLAASVPLIRPVVLAFGSPEFFGFALLGIVFVAALSGGNLTKGVIAGALGLMLALVGLDQQSGIQRYTFGTLDLWDGVQLVPVTVGLFGVGELVDLWLKQKSIAEMHAGKIGGVWQGVRDTFVHWGLTLRCSLIGTLLGIIPGLGGAVAQWLTYAHAVQSAKDKSQFGNGDVRGVLGPGAAMNSKEGGNLITAVAFGIPGSVSIAILLGAFLILGVQPGPSMLTTHLDLTFSFVWVIIISHIISVAGALVLLRPMVRLTEIRASLIVPGIVLLVLYGGFSDRSSLFDMGVTLAAGFLGMIMAFLNWPRPPLILGLVLGKLIERNLFISYTRYEFSFLLRPLLLALILLGVSMVLAPYAARWFARRFGLKEQLIVTETG
jgi:TctA family transporter